MQSHQLNSDAFWPFYLAGGANKDESIQDIANLLAGDIEVASVEKCGIEVRSSLRLKEIRGVLAS